MNCDFLVIGGGIAGASAAFELSRHGRVVVIEREERPAYHTTGRSAAFFTVNYGNRVIRALTIASEAMLADPPDIFGETPLMSPRGIVTFAREDQLERFEENLVEARHGCEDIHRIDVDEALRLLPVLRPDYVAAAHLEPGSMYLDVDLILNGYLRGMTDRGGRLVCDAEARAIERRGDVWRVDTVAGAVEAPVLVNAAGAWADEIARLAGLAPVGLCPSGAPSSFSPARRTLCWTIARWRSTSTRISISSPRPARSWPARPTKRHRRPATRNPRRSTSR